MCMWILIVWSVAEAQNAAHVVLETVKLFSPSNKSANWIYPKNRFCIDRSFFTNGFYMPSERNYTANGGGQAKLSTSWFGIHPESNVTNFLILFNAASALIGVLFGAFLFISDVKTPGVVLCGLSFISGATLVAGKVTRKLGLFVSLMKFELLIFPLVLELVAASSLRPRGAHVVWGVGALVLEGIYGTRVITFAVVYALFVALTVVSASENIVDVEEDASEGTAETLSNYLFGGSFIVLGAFIGSVMHMTGKTGSSTVEPEYDEENGVETNIASMVTPLDCFGTSIFIVDAVTSEVKWANQRAGDEFGTSLVLKGSFIKSGHALSTLWEMLKSTINVNSLEGKPWKIEGDKDEYVLHVGAHISRDADIAVMLVKAPKRPKTVERVVKPSGSGIQPWEVRRNLVGYLAPGVEKCMSLLKSYVDSLPSSDDPGVNVTMEKVTDMLALTQDCLDDVKDFVRLETEICSAEREKQRAQTAGGESKASTPNPRLTPSRVEFLLNNCLIRAKDSCRDLCLEGVTVTHEVDKAIPCGTVWGDSAVLHTILMHLIFNAAKHTPSPGNISLRVEFVERLGIEKIRLRFVVSDTGRGMDLDNPSGVVSPPAQKKSLRGMGTKDDDPSTPSARSPSAQSKISSFRAEGRRASMVPTADVADAAQGHPLFTPFAKGSSSLSRPFNLEMNNNRELVAMARAEGLERAGSGMGLAEVALLVQKLDGNISVCSVETPASAAAAAVAPAADVAPAAAAGGGKGGGGRRGTTVSFTSVFDIGQTVGAANVSLGTPPATPGIRRRNLKVKSVLVVDDEKVNRRVVGRLLTNSNYQVEMACDGQEALNLLFPKGGGAGKTYSVILMDVNMPQMTGMRATEIIRSKGSKIPVLALTGDNSKENQMRCMWSGMTSFIGKPFKKDNVLTTVNKWSTMEHSNAKDFMSVEGDRKNADL